MPLIYRSKSSKTAKHLTTVYLDEDIREYLERKKHITDRTMAWWINNIIRQYKQAEHDRDNNPQMELSLR
jgi:hypothetical protein